ncbi:hypothetical protein SAMN04488000_11399 [Lentzea albida]|uniref:Uncharacterized protein n=2 Tax=Lentzea albida TaxID=65499 RepID=A0A1H9T2K6_9PSEU|nr:hypothetical protein SAMN04488000_11399 [Lentzea albida]
MDQRVWLVLPFVFSAAVFGLMGAGGLLIGDWSSVPLSPVVSGAGVAVAAAVSGGVRWRRSWQRNWLRWPYLAAVLVLGVVVGAVEVPALAAAVVGLPVLMGLVFQCLVQSDENRHTAGCR